jgi:uncharacterized protein (TIGR02001 family)
MKLVTLAVFSAFSCSVFAETTANVNLLSDYRLRGISQTSKQPVVQAGIDYVHSTGMYAGTLFSNVSRDQFPGAGLESDFYGGYKHEIADKLSLS